MPADASRLSELVLAIDTCGPRPRVALKMSTGVTTAAPDATDARADDAAALAEGLLRAAGRRVDELTGIGVTIGPGSYTGVRIGLALVRGLSIVDHIPVVGAGTLELLATAAEVPEERIGAVLDAGADKLYVAVFERLGDGLRGVLEPQVVGRSELATLIDDRFGNVALVRSGDEPEVVCGRPVVAVPGDRRIATLADLSARRLQRGDGTPADRVLPRYVGTSGAQPNRNKVATAAFPDE